MVRLMVFVRSVDHAIELGLHYSKADGVSGLSHDSEPDEDGTVPVVIDCNSIPDAQAVLAQLAQDKRILNP